MKGSSEGVIFQGMKIEEHCKGNYYACARYSEAEGSTIDAKDLDMDTLEEALARGTSPIAMKGGVIVVFDPDHFAKRVIQMQSELWDAFMDWYGGRETQGNFIDKANLIKKQYEQYFLDLQKGAQSP